MAETKHLVVGLMSGTSADGVDTALLETDGEGFIRPLAFAEHPYDEAGRAAIRAACARARELGRPEKGAEDPVIARAARLLTDAHWRAVASLPGGERATLIAFPGQTLLHRPPSSGDPHPFTWQIGDAAALARRTGRPVVHDFRSADVAAGGEGAPLAPGYHRARLAGQAGPVAILNLGGVANLSWFERPADAGAPWGGFDTGPGNALLDDFVRARTAAPFDCDGALAASGRVDEGALRQLLAAARPAAGGPHSFDRDEFDAAPVAALEAADGAATLAAFTAEAVALGVRALPCRPVAIYATGGGRRNPALLRMIGERSHCPVEPVEALGWNGDALEAECFAWLAVRSLRGLPLSWPETTGTPCPTPGGVVVRPASDRSSGGDRDSG